MSSLTAREKAKLEKLFKMQDGWVLHFSDATIGTFFGEEVGIDIHDQKYQGIGTSKAKKLREFWRIEDDYIVGKATKAMIEEAEEKVFSTSSFLTSYEEKNEENEAEKKLIEDCKSISTRLCVLVNNCPGKATMHSTKSCSTKRRRISPSLLVLELIEPLANKRAIEPVGAR